MNRRTNTSQNSSHTNRQIKTRSNRAGIVFDVVLNEDFAGLSDTDSENFSTGKDTSVIGSVINCSVAQLFPSVETCA